MKPSSDNGVLHLENPSSFLTKYLCKRIYRKGNYQMSKQSVLEIIDTWETHGLKNLHEINLDRIYAFPLTRNDLDILESGIQWTLDFHGISRQKLMETKNE